MKSAHSLRSIPSILKLRAEEERSHAGAIFIDDKTIAPGDIGGSVIALLELVKHTLSWDWRNRIYFLRR